MKYYIIDTHTLFWYLTDNIKISQKVKEIIYYCDGINSQAIIPTIVLAEFLYLCNKYKLNINVNDIVTALSESDDFFITPFDIQIFFELLELPNNLEMHDRIIAATSLIYNAPVLTRDTVITESNLIDTIW